MTHNLKPYPAYKPSGVEWLGDIPSGWDVAKVKYSSYLKARIGWQNLRTDEFVESGPYCVTGTDFKNGRIDWTNCYHVSESRYELDPKIQLDSKDILITKDGTIGKVAHVEELPDCATLNSGIFVVRPLKESYSTRFMYWVLSSNVFGSFIDYIRNGSTIHHLYQYSFERFQFPVPSKGEQHRIATFLDQKTAEIDEAINKKQRLIELLKEQKSILINQAITKGLNPNIPMRDSGVEWIGEIPAHWEVGHLGYYAVVTNGSTPSRDVPRYWFGGTIPWIASGKVNDFIITEPSEWVTPQAVRECSLRLYGKGTILVGIVGQGKTRGTSALLDIETCINQNVAAIEPGRDVDSGFLHRYLIQAYQQVRDYGKGSNQGALNCTLVRAIKITIPPLSEQIAIVSRLREVESHSATATLAIEKELDSLTEYRAVLISDAVTGKIKV